MNRQIANKVFALFFSIYLLAIKNEMNDITKRIETGNTQDKMKVSTYLFFIFKLVELLPDVSLLLFGSGS